MALPKVSDAGVQNKTQDAGADRIDALHQTTTNTGKDKNSSKNNKSNKNEKTDSPKQKEKGYKEGNKDDSITDEDFDEDEKSYGKRL